MDKKILILGKGLISESLQRGFGCPIEDCKIRTLGDVEKIIRKYKPRLIINCIDANGRGNVDSCEFQKDKTLFANSFIPLLLAETALRANIKLVHVGSACIFNFDYKKDRPVKENLTPDFLSLFYSRSRIYADLSLEVLSRRFNILIARIRIPLVGRPHPENILDKLIRYKRVITIKNSVTYVPDFVRALKHLIKIDARGVYNVVNKGGLSYPELLDVYRKYVPGFRYETIDFHKLGLVRTNMLISTHKLEQAGFKVRPVSSVLEECVRDYIRKAYR